MFCKYIFCTKIDNISFVLESKHFKITRSRICCLFKNNKQTADYPTYLYSNKVIHLNLYRIKLRVELIEKRLPHTCPVNLYILYNELTSIGSIGVN